MTIGSTEPRSAEQLQISRRAALRRTAAGAGVGAAALAAPSIASMSVAPLFAAAQSVVVCDPDGTGTADLTLNTQTGEVGYTLTVQNIDPPNAAHIHEGPFGANGPVRIGLPIGGGLMGTTTSTPAQVQAVVDNPTGFYVNIHNAPCPGGAVRGQLTSVTPGPVQASTTPLMGTGEPDRSGSIDLTFNTDTGEICWNRTDDLTSTVTLMHIHTGGPGVNGPVFIGLGTAPTGCITASPADVQTVLDDPNGHYVNVHTDVAGAGAIRGQVAGTTVSTFTAMVDLEGTQEVP